MFAELFAHGVIELCHDLFQRRGCLGEVVVLPLEESIAFHELLIFLDGAHIDIAKCFDLTSQTCDFLFHCGQVCQCLIARGSRVRNRDLIFLPHKGGLLFNGFFEPFPPGGQAEHFLVEPGNDFCCALAVPRSFLLPALQFLVLLPQRLQFLFLSALYMIGIGRFLPEVFDPFCLLFNLPAVIFPAARNLLQLGAESLQLASDTFRVLALEAKALLCTAVLDLQGRKGGTVALLVLLSLRKFLLQTYCGSSKLFFSFLAGRQIFCRRFLLRCSLLRSFRKRAEFLPQRFGISGRLAELLLLLLDPDPECVLADKTFLKCPLVLIKLSAQDIAALLGVFDGLFLLLQFRSEAFGARSQFFDLTASSQKAAGIAVGTAADRAAGRKQLSLQGHHPHAVSGAF